MPGRPHIQSTQLTQALSFFQLHFNIIPPYVQYTTCSAFCQLLTWENLFLFSEKTHVAMYIFEQHQSAFSLCGIFLKYNYTNNIKNFSPHEGVFARLFRNVDNKLPGDTASHLISNDTEWSWSHLRWNWRSWGTNKPKGIEVKILKYYLEMKMLIWDDNIKMDIKESSFVLYLIIHYNTG